ncbi:hypothetical protein V5O48_006524 [Marasmius crinis-equi]|uniref:Uncharacterized protein n=1 Tax=Marasmius crinis-equi TaxID=585013 RepID=A0ABR3FJ98_9AGAR
MSSPGKDRRKSSRRTTLSTGNTKKSKVKSSSEVQSSTFSALSSGKLGDSNEEVKREDSPIIWFRPTPTPVTDTVHYGWQHPAELEYLTPTDWTDTQIIHHLIAHSFDIPPRQAKGSPFFEVTGIDGSRTVLPSGYRIPLMFIARFQWLSLKLVLSTVDRDAEWREYKYGILHVSRLCKKLLQAAQESMGGFDTESGAKTRVKGIDRKWRSQMFDRALARYKLKWFISEPEQLQEFWDTYKDEEYKKDPLKYGTLPLFLYLQYSVPTRALDWRRWALKGHKGFSLTEDEIENGITAQQLMGGLKDKSGRWFWEEPNTPTSDDRDAWELRHEARHAAISPTPSLAPPLISLAPRATTSQQQAQETASTTPFSISQAKPPSSASSSDTPKPQPQKPLVTPNSKAKHLVSASAEKTLSPPVKRPGAPLEKDGAVKAQKTGFDNPMRAATRRTAPVTHSITESDSSPPPFSPAIPNIITPGIKHGFLPDTALRPVQSLASNGKHSASSVARPTLSVAPQAAAAKKVVQAQESETLTLGLSQSPASASSVASSAQSPVTRPGFIQIPTIPPVSLQAPNGKTTTSTSNPLSPDPASPSHPTSKSNIPPIQSQPAGKLATTTDWNSHPAVTMNMRGPHDRSFPNVSSPTTKPASSVSINNAVIPAKPSSPVLMRNGTALSPNSNSNQVMLRAVESLFGGFTESTKKFSSELDRLKEDGIREVKDALREIIREETHIGVRSVVEGATRSSQAADLDMTVQKDVAPVLKDGLSGIGAMVGQEIETTVRPLRLELAGLLEQIRSSRQREEALFSAIQETRNEMRRLEGSGSLDALPSTSPMRSVIGLQSSSSSFTGHPLAHLLGSSQPESGPQIDPMIAPGMHDDDNESLFYPPTPREEVQVVSLAQEFGRSARGTPMSMSPDILLIESEPMEKKYRAPLTQTPISHFPPTPSSPINTDEIEDVKPVLINGRAFLPNMEGEEPTPLSAFVPRRFMKKGAGI